MSVRSPRKTSDPLPFSQVAFEPRQSLQYRTNLQTLIAKARDQLAESDPEAFKVFLLAIMVGLRRKGCRGLPDIFERWFSCVRLQSGTL